MNIGNSKVIDPKSIARVIPPNTSVNVIVKIEKPIILALESKNSFFCIVSPFHIL
ncbi:hypothetical protein J19TS1_41110 [Heyndrickxia oleronia]|nr:hypothetical protein J19TS1_41110 [Heyndrickxia oleronia]